FRQNTLGCPADTRPPRFARLFRQNTLGCPADTRPPRFAQWVKTAGYSRVGWVLPGNPILV
ncbi:hypothetical protein, partial [Mobiluncus mulieris]|uniref:hypothetical protein n=1 Tax=Mobiluncus mulieris TaxID=2052 RepID=UPI00242DD0AA